MGTKGIGEIGIVGTAAAIANAVYHATGIRVRDLPITLWISCSNTVAYKNKRGRFLISEVTTEDALAHVLHAERTVRTVSRGVVFL